MRIQLFSVKRSAFRPEPVVSVNPSCPELVRNDQDRVRGNYCSAPGNQGSSHLAHTSPFRSGFGRRHGSRCLNPDGHGRFPDRHGGFHWQVQFYGHESGSDAMCFRHPSFSSPGEMRRNGGVLLDPIVPPSSNSVFPIHYRNHCIPG